ncbi:MAG: alpha/beta hydrolase [Candidatus Hydrogenedentes bacterium]|nr:alpha/beta hydrolase [Candidatus Hydrogenedentota bacterium]
MCDWIYRIAAPFVLSAVAFFVAADEPETVTVLAGFVVKQDVIYGAQSDKQRLDIVYPAEGKSALPLVVHFHSGGWYTGGKSAFQMLNMLAEAGYASASVGYRLSDEAPFPAAVEDCKLAVRFLRAHAPEYRIDPDHIGAIGASAGGHLAAMLAVTTKDDGLEGIGGYNEQSSAVQAAVAVCAPLNLEVPLSLNIHGDDPVVVRFLGGPLSEMREAARRASPIAYVKPSTPPIYLLHGTADKRVHSGQSTAMAETLTKAGVPHEIVLVEGGNHGMGIAREPQAFAEIVKFLNKYLKPAPKTP